MAEYQTVKKSVCVRERDGGVGVVKIEINIVALCDVNLKKLN